VEPRDLLLHACVVDALEHARTLVDRDEAGLRVQRKHPSRRFAGAGAEVEDASRVELGGRRRHAVL